MTQTAIVITVAYVVDLGGIRSARGTEIYLALWLSLWGTLGTGYFNIGVVRGEG